MNSQEKYEQDLVKSVAMTKNEKRARAIAQNGNEGTHYSWVDEICPSHDMMQEQIDAEAIKEVVYGNDTPQHYSNEKEYDVIDIAKDYNLNFNRGNIVKYVVRAGKKEDELKDLKKALDYLQREIKHLSIRENI